MKFGGSGNNLTSLNSTDDARDNVVASRINLGSAFVVHTLKWTSNSV